MDEKAALRTSKLANCNMNDYISGGYYVVKGISRPPDLSNVLPGTLLTMSACFTSVVREIIQLQWDEYTNVSKSIAEEASKFWHSRGTDF
jgi:hypothetical protein